MQDVFTVFTTFSSAGHTLLFILLFAFKSDGIHLLVGCDSPRSERRGRKSPAFFQLLRQCASPRIVIRPVSMATA